MDKWHYQTSGTNCGIEDNEYAELFLCDNCGEDIYVAIKLGVRIKDIHSEVACENCGCRQGASNE